MALASVGAWARALPGAESVSWSLTHEYLYLTAPVPSLEAAFGVTYHHYSVPALSECFDLQAIRASSPLVLPPALVDYVDITTPDDRLPSLRWLSSYKTVREGAGAGGVTPTTIRAAYSVPPEAMGTSGLARTLVSGFDGEFASQPDLDTFFALFAPPPFVDTQLNVVGPNDGKNPGVEAALDVQYVSALGNNISTTFWYSPGGYGPENEPFVAFLANVSALPDSTLPHTISISYGDNENTVPYPYAVKTRTGFMALGARGVSVLVSSGDGGVSGGQSGPCGPGDTFIPTFPAGLSVITSVGGTNGQPETAASFSSGGFSDYWPIPKFQAAAIQAYKDLGVAPPQKYWNASGAGIPDVSAFAENFQVVVGGKTIGVAGTSCSAPTVSGLVALLNDARLGAGKKALGFLNTLFYTNAAAFTDVTTGSNPGCGTQGFPAAKGWDPVTGLGSPNFGALYTLVMSLP